MKGKLRGTWGRHHLFHHFSLSVVPSSDTIRKKWPETVHKGAFGPHPKGILRFTASALRDQNDESS